MRSLGTRRVAQVAGAATVAVIALAGCSAGQVAETALLQTPISGLNTASPDGGLLIRNLQVLYNGTAGYAAGASAPLEVSLFNQTRQPITVAISSSPQQGQAGVVSAQQVGVVGGAAPADSAAAPAPSESPAAPAPSDSAASPAPSDSASAPAAPSAQPAKFTIAPLGSKSFLPGDPETLQLIGLSDKLLPGNSVSLVFETSTSSQPLQVFAPIAIPLSPASRAPGLPDENSEG